MTKKDFELIALVIRTSVDNYSSVLEPCGRAAMAGLIVRLTNALAGTNPRFDRARFMDVCHYGAVCSPVNPGVPNSAGVPNSGATPGSPDLRTALVDAAISSS